MRGAVRSVKVPDEKNNEAAENVRDREMRVMNHQGDNGNNNRSDEVYGHRDGRGYTHPNR
jgi:hypothetical protein